MAKPTAAGIISPPVIETFTGEVESVSWGVSEFPKLSITGLPVVERELDWVQLSQDFPVRIRFTESVPPDLLSRRRDRYGNHFHSIRQGGAMTCTRRKFSLHPRFVVF